MKLKSSKFTKMDRYMLVETIFIGAICFLVETIILLNYSMWCYAIVFFVVDSLLIIGHIWTWDNDKKYFYKIFHSRLGSFAIFILSIILSSSAYSLLEHTIQESCTMFLFTLCVIIPPLWVYHNIVIWKKDSLSDNGEEKLDEKEN